MRPLQRLLDRLHRAPAHFWAGVLLVLLLSLLGLLTHNSHIPGAVLVQSARLLPQGADGPEGDAVVLPHEWAPEKRNRGGESHYRLSLPTSLRDDVASDRHLSVLLPRVGVRFRLLFNGHELAAQGWYRGEGYFDTGVRAQVIDLPRSLFSLRWEDNRLDIGVQGQALRISGLAPVWIGPSRLLHGRQAWLSWWQVSLTWMACASAIMLGLMSLILWVKSSERLLGFLAGGMLALSVRLWLSTPVFLPGPFLAWDYLHKLSFTWYCGFMYLFMSELFEFRQGTVRKIVNAMMLIGPLWLAVQVWALDYRMYRVWTGFIAVVCVLSMLKIIHRARWGMDASQRMVVVVCAAALVTGLRDFLVVQVGLPGDADIRWMTAGSLVLMYAMGWVLVRRTARSMEQFEQLNAELALKVREREAELRRVFDQLRVVENQRVLEAERRRLTRDMHDGLGSQLVQALNLVHSRCCLDEGASVAAMLTQALEELRMTLDSLEPMDGDLPTILGTLRQRIAPTLEAAHIELDWQVEDVPAVPGLEVRGVMHLFRCLQEVFANVIKHARASRVTVRTWERGGRVYLSAADNGLGLNGGEGGAGRSGGRGIANIRMRASEIGAEVLFSAAHPGTCVTFSFATGKAVSSLETEDR